MKFISIKILFLLPFWLFFSCNGNQDAKWDQSQYIPSLVKCFLNFSATRYKPYLSEWIKLVEINLKVKMQWDENGEKGCPEISQEHLDQFGQIKSESYKDIIFSFNQLGGGVQKRLAKKDIPFKNNYTYFSTYQMEFINQPNFEKQKEKIKKRILYMQAVAGTHQAQPTLPFHEDMQTSKFLITRNIEPILIIGWDDNLTLDNQKGAWLVFDIKKQLKFWVSYSDPHLAKSKWSGAISPLFHYGHKDVNVISFSERLNPFLTKGIRSLRFPYFLKPTEKLTRLGFFVAQPKSVHSFKLFNSEGQLIKKLEEKEFDDIGFYQIPIDPPLQFDERKEVYVEITNPKGVFYFTPRPSKRKVYVLDGQWRRDEKRSFNLFLYLEAKTIK